MKPSHMTDSDRIADLERRVAEFKIADDRYQLMKLVVEGHSAELRGAKPIGEASRSNDVLGVD